MDEKIVKLQELIDQHDNIVLFGGTDGKIRIIKTVDRRFR